MTQQQKQQRVYLVPSNPAGEIKVARPEQVTVPNYTVTAFVATKSVRREQEEMDRNFRADESYAFMTPLVKMRLDERTNELVLLDWDQQLEMNPMVQAVSDCLTENGRRTFRDRVESLVNEALDPNEVHTHLYIVLDDVLYTLDEELARVASTPSREFMHRILTIGYQKIEWRVDQQPHHYAPFLQECAKWETYLTFLTHEKMLGFYNQAYDQYLADPRVR